MTPLHKPRAAHKETDVAQSPLARLAGPIALAAGALMTVQQLVMYPIVDRSHLIATIANPLFVPSAIAYVVAFCELLIALVAVYAWQANRAGAFGVIGFVAALVGTLFLAGDAWFEAFAIPWLADVAPEALHKPSGLLIATRSSASWGRTAPARARRSNCCWAWRSPGWAYGCCGRRRRT